VQVGISFAIRQIPSTQKGVSAGQSAFISHLGAGPLSLQPSAISRQPPATINIIANDKNFHIVAPLVSKFFLDYSSAKELKNNRYQQQLILFPGSTEIFRNQLGKEYKIYFIKSQNYL
jgi:hypothetical protein